MAFASEGDLQHLTETMTASFITETIDQELQLTELQKIKCATLPFFLAWGMGAAKGAMGKYLRQSRSPC